MKIKMQESRQFKVTSLVSKNGSSSKFDYFTTDQETFETVLLHSNEVIGNVRDYEFMANTFDGDQIIVDKNDTIKELATQGLISETEFIGIENFSNSSSHVIEIKLL